MPTEVQLRDEAAEEFRNLQTRPKFEAAGLLLRLETEPLFGLPLGDQPPGDLSDCRKIYFDDRRLRIVYRLLPSAQNPLTADVIAIGAREALEVYEIALERLGRETHE